MSRLVVMGSGETAPTMVRTHRAVLAETFGDGPPAPGTALALDTTFGFQDNADELVDQDRCSTSCRPSGTPVEIATWRRADAPTADAERTLARLGRARWLFAGPGSPTYALRQWRGTGVGRGHDATCVRRGGTLVVGSAAACTIGSHAVPGVRDLQGGRGPRTGPTGLDVLGAATGIRAALVPHFDNAEGGGYDTRFCYLGRGPAGRHGGDAARGRRGARGGRAHRAARGHRGAAPPRWPATAW